MIKLSEEGGEIRQIDTREEVRFSQEDMQRAGGLEKLTLKCEVSFALKDASESASPSDVKVRNPAGFLVCLQYTLHAVVHMHRTLLDGCDVTASVLDCG